jgi:two-component system cell cycle sensor histidine kinase/response regulator CckA
MTSPELALAAIVQSSQDAIIGHSLDGTITSWNAAAERMYRCSADDVMGHPASRLVPPELHDVERRLIERMARGAVVTTVDTTRVRVDGSRLLVSLSLFPILDETGKALALVAIERDITHLRAVEAQLQQAKRIESVGRLAGGVAQEFNNINTAILGLVDSSAPCYRLAKRGAKTSMRSRTRLCAVRDWRVTCSASAAGKC